MKQHFPRLSLVIALVLIPLLRSSVVDAQISVVTGVAFRDDANETINLCIQSASPVTEETTVDYAILDGTATEGEDFTLNVDNVGNITIPSNATEACLENAVVYIDDDDLYESNQSYVFQVTGLNVTDGMQSTTYIILDSTDPPEIIFSLPSYTFLEADTNITVTIEVTTDNVFVQSPAVVTGDVTTLPGSASANDYFLPPDSVVTITDGNMGSFDIIIVGDDVFEGDEDFSVEISSMIVSVTITDDESPPEVTLIAPEAIFKPDRMVDLCARTNVLSQTDIIVVYTTYGIEADYGKDYNISSGQNGSITIDSGSLEGCAVLNVLDDLVFEANETIVFSLTSVTPGNLGDPSSATIPIVDNEGTPALTVTALMYVDEGSADDFMICVDANVSSVFVITVPYQFIDDTAIHGQDYIVPRGVNGSLEFQPMEVSSCVAVTIVDDMVYEDIEAFRFVITDPTNAMVGNPSEVTVTIVENDALPVLSIQPLSSPVLESAGNISVCVNANILSVFESKVRFEITDGTANAGEDYSVYPSAPNELSFAPGVMSMCVTINIVDDMVYEGDEDFMFMLSGPSMATLDDQAASIDITITDNEGFPFLSIQAPSSVDESVGNFNVCAITNVSSASVITVDCDKSDISTTETEDYTLSLQSPNGFQFEPRGTVECLTVTVIDDADYEGDELLSFSLINPANANLSDPSSVTITIVDNDPSPVPSPSPSPTEPTPESDSLLYIIIGAVGGVVLAALTFLLIIILCIVCCRMKINRQGFYVTDEDKGDAPQMLRYSASLRSISSQTVVPVDTRDKENEYMV